jgi:hypothetical protein
LGCVFSCLFIYADHLLQDVPYLKKTHYNLKKEPLDVIIPCGKQDVDMLPLCVEGIKANVKDVRRIIVVSEDDYMGTVEWFDEKLYPFNKFDIAFEIFLDEEKATQYLKTKGNRIGWIYQQLLKLYAPMIIPDISSNVLIVDADTVFLNPVAFMNEKGEGLYALGREYHVPYFVHMNKVIPGLKRVYPQYSGIVHHMLFQRSVLEDLFLTIHDIHHEEPWKVLCHCIQQPEFDMSEYEIYFNFLFQKTTQAQFRPLKWANSAYLRHIPARKKKGYAFVSFHRYLRH